MSKKNPDDDGREPIEVLYAIETETQGARAAALEARERLKEIEPGDVKCNPLEEVEIRRVPSKSTMLYKALHVISERGTATVSDVEGRIGDSASRTLTDLYYAYMVNRVTVRAPHEYELSALGERVLERVENAQNADAHESERSNVATPWGQTPVTRGEWFALRAIHEHEDSPTTKEANPHFKKISGLGSDHSTTIAISPYLSNLVGKDFVDRTPTQPYRYWLTEAGRNVIES